MGLSGWKTAFLWHFEAVLIYVDGLSIPFLHFHVYSGDILIFGILDTYCIIGFNGPTAKTIVKHGTKPPVSWLTCREPQWVCFQFSSVSPTHAQWLPWWQEERYTDPQGSSRTSGTESPCAPGLTARGHIEKLFMVYWYRVSYGGYFICASCFNCWVKFHQRQCSCSPSAVKMSCTSSSFKTRWRQYMSTWMHAWRTLKP